MVRSTDVGPKISNTNYLVLICVEVLYFISYSINNKSTFPKYEIDPFVREKLTMTHWIRIILLCVIYFEKTDATFWKQVGTTCVDQTTTLRRVIGCLQYHDKTPVLGLRRCGLRRFFLSQKQHLQKQMYMY